MIRTVSLSNLCNVEKAGDLNFMIVRNLKAEIKGVSHLPSLAPSQELYEFYLNHRNESGFDWFTPFSEAYQKELETHEKDVGLKLVENYARLGYTVNLICYCSSRQCHRTLVAQELRNRGLNVNEYD